MRKRVRPVKMKVGPRWKKVKRLKKFQRKKRQLNFSDGINQKVDISEYIEI